MIALSVVDSWALALPLRAPCPVARGCRVIKGYVTVVDQTKVGLPISVFASIKLERQREEELDRFAAAVERWPEIVDCYLMTGQRDFLLCIVVKDLPAYETFLKQKLTRLEGVASIESSFALGKRNNRPFCPCWRRSRVFQRPSARSDASSAISRASDRSQKAKLTMCSRMLCASAVKVKSLIGSRRA
jgi:Lrp/AsnC family leucine-responsive transcriptional regulator